MPALPPTPRRPPARAQYALVHYDHADAELAVTDLQLLQGQARPPPTPHGRYQALRLAFSLPAASYATMLIRELTKQPTSTDFHKTLQHHD